MDAIVTYNLSKTYHTRQALSGLNLQIPEGQAFACVGPERSGKATLIRLLSGLTRPTSGECSVFGLSPSFEADKLHAVAGTVLDSARLYEHLTVSENLSFFAGLNGVEENDALDRLSFLLHRLDIWESRDIKVDDLPTSVAHRACLARALMHRPRVLMLDESEQDLDLEAADSVKELLRYLTTQEGSAVLLCTEDMDYAQEACEYFGLLQEGVLLAKGTIEELRRGAGVRFRAVLRLGEGDAPPRGFHMADGRWEKEIDSEEELPKLISQVVKEGKQLFEAHLARPTLEEIYAAFLAGGVYRAGDEDEQDDEYQDDETEWEAEQDDGDIQAVSTGQIVPDSFPQEDGTESGSVPAVPETGAETPQRP